jgi:hypothetical protein
MYRIDSDGSVASLPSPAALRTEGYWSKGDPGTGQAATLEDQDWFNTVQESLIAILTAGGIAHSKSEYSRLWQAILRCSTFLDTGSANAIVVTPPVAIPSSAIGFGMSLTVKLAANNTSTTVNMTVSGTAGSVKDAAGNPPPIGSLVAGRMYLMVHDGANWRAHALGTGIRPTEYVNVAPGVTSTSAPTWAGLVFAEVWGGGGGGSGGTGASGAGGGYAAGYYTVIPGSTLSITVGAGGAGASSGAAAGNGGSSSLGGTVSATGGIGGAAGMGAGGGGVGGIINIQGGSGEDLDATQSSARGGDSPRGGMGGIINSSGAQISATFPGGGGGANTNNAAGQAGAPGGVHLIFYP